MTLNLPKSHSICNRLQHETGELIYDLGTKSKCRVSFLVEFSYEILPLESQHEANLIES